LRDSSPPRKNFARARSDVTWGSSNAESSERVRKQAEQAAALEEQVRERDTQRASDRIRKFEEDKDDLRRMGLHDIAAAIRPPPGIVAYGASAGARDGGALASS